MCDLAKQERLQKLKSESSEVTFFHRHSERVTILRHMKSKLLVSPQISNPSPIDRNPGKSNPGESMYVVKQTNSQHRYLAFPSRRRLMTCLAPLLSSLPLLLSFFLPTVSNKMLPNVCMNVELKIGVDIYERINTIS